MKNSIRRLGGGGVGIKLLPRVSLLFSVVGQERVISEIGEVLLKC